MSEITVKAVQPVLGLPPEGAVVTVEHTPRVEAAIRSGHLVVVEGRPFEEGEPRSEGAVSVVAPDPADDTNLADDDFVEPGDDD